MTPGELKSLLGTNWYRTTNETDTNYRGGQRTWIAHKATGGLRAHTGQEGQLRVRMALGISKF